MLSTSIVDVSLRLYAFELYKYGLLIPGLTMSEIVLSLLFSIIEYKG